MELKVFILLVILLTLDKVRSAGRTNNNITDGGHRRGKLFSLFNIVKFNNEGCRSTDTLAGGNRNGTCYTTAECQSRSGNAHGTCAAGFGVCCVFTITSNSGTVRENCTYIQNDGFPSMTSTAETVTYTINKCSADVCFLRLDFEQFTINGVGGTNLALEGVCMDEFTVTTATSQSIPIICGENAGQHIYTDIGRAAGDSSTIRFNLNGNGNRIWDIKVTQVECSNRNSPPEGCLQYHTALTGRMTTFNFSPTADTHLNNQDYSVCIRAEAGFCCVQYQVCPDEMSAFSLSPKDSAAIDTMSDIDTHCTLDYIGISQSSALPCQQGNSHAGTHNKYCGLFLNAFLGAKANVPICDCTAPFSIDVVTNAFSDVDIAGAGGAAMINTIHSRGVCLEWQQIPCTN